MAMTSQNATAAAATMAATETQTISIGQILPWAFLAAVVAALSYYFIGTEQGATALFAGADIHEFVHDARHLLGFPCH